MSARQARTAARPHWQNPFLGSLGLHVLLLLGLAAVSAGWFKTEIPPQPEIEVVFSEGSGNPEAGGRAGGAGAAADMPAISSPQRLNDAAFAELVEQAAAEPKLSEAVAMQTAKPISQQVKSLQQVAATGSLSDMQAETAKTAAAASGEGEGAGAEAGAGKGAGEGTGQGSGNGPGDKAGIFGGGGFSSNGDGTYTALSSAGIEYTLLRDAQAVYPEEARAIDFAQTVAVEARLLVGLDGSVESVEILSSVPKLGFREAAQQAFYGMRFAPIYYQGQNIKMYFLKTIYFQP